MLIHLPTKQAHTNPFPAKCGVFRVVPMELARSVLPCLNLLFIDLGSYNDEDHEMSMKHLLLSLVFLGLSVPLSRAADNAPLISGPLVTKEVIEGRTLKPGIIGITLMCRYPEQIKRGEEITSNTKSNDCYVAKIFKGFPADLDGRLKKGDRITFVDGVKIEDISLDEVTRLISGRIGTNVNIQVKGEYGPIQLERIAP